MLLLTASCCCREEHIIVVVVDSGDIITAEDEAEQQLSLSIKGEEGGEAYLMSGWNLFNRAHGLLDSPKTYGTLKIGAVDAAYRN